MALSQESKALQNPFAHSLAWMVPASVVVVVGASVVVVATVVELGDGELESDEELRSHTSALAGVVHFACCARAFALGLAQ